MPFVAGDQPGEDHPVEAGQAGKRARTAGRLLDRPAARWIRGPRTGARHRSGRRRRRRSGPTARSRPSGSAPASTGSRSAHSSACQAWRRLCPSRWTCTAATGMSVTHSPERGVEGVLDPAVLAHQGGGGGEVEEGGRRPRVARPVGGFNRLRDGRAARPTRARSRDGRGFRQPPRPPAGLAGAAGPDPARAGSGW